MSAEFDLIFNFHTISTLVCVIVAAITGRHGRSPTTTQMVASITVSYSRLRIREHVGSCDKLVFIRCHGLRYNSDASGPPSEA